MKETNYCDKCKVKRCELRDYVSFCEDCKFYPCKPPLSTTCKDGHYVECNCFEPCDDYEEDEE